MNELQIFSNPEFGQIRMVKIDDKLFTVGNDVASALEYVRPYEAITAHCKGAVSYRVLTNGGEQVVKVIPEGDIYRLIVKAADQSKNPVIREKAERFERWIFDEVLPAIRKHGLYATEDLLNDPDLAIKAFTALKEERERNKELLLLNAQNQQIIHELQPKATYYDLVLQNKSLLSVSKIAKDYGMSAIALNSKLHELGIQFKQGDVWLLYQKYADKGYTQSKTHVIDDEKNKFHTYWTQKGRLFIYDLLKRQEILPLIERQNA